MERREDILVVGFGWVVVGREWEVVVLVLGGCGKKRARERLGAGSEGQESSYVPPFASFTCHVLLHRSGREGGGGGRRLPARDM